MDKKTTSVVLQITVVGVISILRFLDGVAILMNRIAISFTTSAVYVRVCHVLTSDVTKYLFLLIMLKVMCLVYYIRFLVSNTYFSM